MSNGNGNGSGGLSVAPLNTLITHTIRDSGVVVQIAKVNPLLVREITKNFPPPKPPLNRVMYGDEVVFEPNESDPSHQQALKDHDEEVNTRLINLLLKRGVVVEMTEERIREVKELRRDMEQYGKSELTDDDKLVWIKYCAVATPEDMQELVTAITQRSQPSEVAIRDNIATFQR